MLGTLPQEPGDHGLALLAVPWQSPSLDCRRPGLHLQAGWTMLPAGDPGELLPAWRGPVVQLRGLGGSIALLPKPLGANSLCPFGGKAWRCHSKALRGSSVLVLGAGCSRNATGRPRVGMFSPACSRRVALLQSRAWHSFCLPILPRRSLAASSRRLAECQTLLPSPRACACSPRTPVLPPSANSPPRTHSTSRHSRAAHRQIRTSLHFNGVGAAL